jgi:hypothetical protein
MRSDNDFPGDDVDKKGTSYSAGKEENEKNSKQLKCFAWSLNKRKQGEINHIGCTCTGGTRMRLLLHALVVNVK